MPARRASVIILIAMGPWPCPKDNEFSLFPPNPCRKMFYPNLIQNTFPLNKEVKIWITISSANLSNVTVGSAPGVKIKIKGMQQWESLKEAWRSKTGGSMNALPISAKNLKAWIIS